MFVALSCRCLCPVHWSQVLSREWRCSWSSADRRWSNYICVINNFIAYTCVLFIRDLMVHVHQNTMLYSGVWRILLSYMNSVCIRANRKRWIESHPYEAPLHMTRGCKHFLDKDMSIIPHAEQLHTKLTNKNSILGKNIKAFGKAMACSKTIRCQVVDCMT